MIRINNIIKFTDHFLLLLKKNHKILIYSLIFISVVIKSIMLLTYDVSQPPDARKYINIAKYFQNTHNFITDTELSLKLILIAPYMKVYPASIYFFGTNIILILQILMSSIGIYLIFNICKLLTKDILTACIAGFLFFINPFITYYSLLFQYETFFIFFLLTGIYLFLKDTKITSYFIFILSIFISPVIEIGLIIFIFSTLIIFFKYSFLKSLKNVFIFILLYFIFLSISVYNNYKNFGTFEKFYGEAILALEYNEAYAEYGLDFKKISQFQKNLTKEKCPIDSSKINDLYYQLSEQRSCENKVLNEYAINYIKDYKNLGQIIKNIFVRAGRLFSIYPYDTTELHVKIISSLYYSVLYFFLIIYFFNFQFLKIKNHYPLIFLCLISLSIYLLLHSVFRYRVSYDPFLILLASYSIKFVFVKLRLNALTFKKRSLK
jgi:hypothetical protein